MKILAFSSSNSQKSINKQLVQYAAKQLPSHSVDIIDIQSYSLPMYSIDLEETDGIPPAASELRSKISLYDGLLISHAEHNGSYTAVFKNTLDWLSRIDRDIFQQKKMVLLATSPGAGGAKNVLEFALKSAPHFGADVVGSFSLPSFQKNFANGEIKDTDLKAGLLSALQGFEKS